MTSRHQRHVEVPGTANFRDIGGYRTTDGKSVTMFKHFYRSDQLSQVTPEGAKLMKDKLKIKYTIDLRSEEEVKQSPYALYGIERVAIPICPQTFFELIHTKETLDEREAIALISRVGKTFLIDFKEEYRAFFDLLLTKVRGSGSVVHCTAGKDRTGIATALLLYALDVSPEVIREDYLLTNQSVRACTASCVIGKCKFSVGAINVLLAAQAEFFDNAIAKVTELYGSVAVYLEKELQLTPAKIQQLRQYYTRKSSSR